MKALGKRVFVIMDKVDEAPALPQTGVVYTGTKPVTKKPTVGTVHSMGEIVEALKCLKKGDRVYVGEANIESINIFGEDVVVLSYDSIIAVE